MADRIVYLVDKLPRLSASETLEFVDDARLTEITGDGYEVVNTMDRKVTTSAGKSVRATMVVLRPSGENRGVSVRGREPEEMPESRSISVQDEYGRKIAMSPGQAMVHQITRGLARLGTAGHLGPAGDHNLPGMTVISGEMTSKAMDIGALAAARGEQKSANPFPRGTEPHTIWLRGWNNYHGQVGTSIGVSADALARARAEGLALAKELDDDDEVHCPYPKTSPLHEAWVGGFQQGGGRVV